MPQTSKNLLQQLFSRADIRVNGRRSWDIQVHNEDFYDRVLSQGSLGLGESYVDGWWDCKRLDQFFERVLREDLKTPRLDWNALKILITSIVSNMQTKEGSKKIAQVHYDLSSKFYSLFLGPYNQYTSLYYKNTNNFEKAEVARLQLICEKLDLEKKDKVLDIGCGWGGLAKYTAQKIGAHVTGVSISKEQIAYAKKDTKNLSIIFKVQDYRDIRSKYDKIFSGGMIEHVGYKNYRKYFEIIHASLEENGLFLLDCLGESKSVTGPDPWMHKYIFPNSMIPSEEQIARAIKGLFIIEDWHNFGEDYARTTFDWFRKFKKNWKEIKKLSPMFDKRFYRMWSYYLLVFTGALRSRKFQQWQIVLSKNIAGGYISKR